MKNRIIYRLLLNGLLGVTALILVNLAGAAKGFYLGINIVSVYIVGFLGVPGMVLLVALKSIYQYI